MSQRHPEHSLQRAVARFLELIEKRDMNLWWTACNALPGTSARQGAQAKALGQRAGSPDIIGCYCGKFFGFEIKATKGYLSHSQDLAEGAITLAGGHYIVVKSIEDVQQALAALGHQPRRALRRAARA